MLLKRTLSLLNVLNITRAIGPWASPISCIEKRIITPNAFFAHLTYVRANLFCLPEETVALLCLPQERGGPCLPQEAIWWFTVFNEAVSVLTIPFPAKRSVGRVVVRTRTPFFNVEAEKKSASINCSHACT